MKKVEYGKYYNQDDEDIFKHDLSLRFLPKSGGKIGNGKT